MLSVEWDLGEAVAAGMIMAVAMSDIDQAQQERLRSLLQTVGLPTAPPAISPEQLRSAFINR